MITPFFRVRGDFASLDVDNQPGVVELHRHRPKRTGPRHARRGVEYRYPSSTSQPWGTQTVEPIAQAHFAPERNRHRQISERRRAKSGLRRQQPVSDRQIFRLGSRRRRQPRQCRHPIYRSGQPRRLAQHSVRTVVCAVRTELVRGRRYYQYRPGQRPRQDHFGLCGPRDVSAESIYSFTARARFDQATFTPERIEVESRANFDRWTLQLLYGDYAAQPLLGFLTRREGILAGASVKVTENWVVLGSARYDIVNDQFDQTRLGLGYVDDCFMLSLNWLTGYTYNGTTTSGKKQLIYVAVELAYARPRCLIAGRPYVLNSAVRHMIDAAEYMGEQERIGRQSAGGRGRAKSESAIPCPCPMAGFRDRGSCRRRHARRQLAIAHAQEVVLFVDGQPITALDIEQRAKFLEMSIHKAPTRQEVIDSLDQRDSGITRGQALRHRPRRFGRERCVHAILRPIWAWTRRN